MRRVLNVERHGGPIALDQFLFQIPRSIEAKPRDARIGFHPTCEPRFIVVTHPDLARRPALNAERQLDLQ
jgi:hypothetical protein